MNYSRIAILGAGLLGGSIALAVKERKLAAEISIFDHSSEVLDEIRRTDLTPWLFNDAAKAVEEAELVILCTPISAMKRVMENAKSALSPFAIVTDVGSVKSPVVEIMEPLLHGAAKWIGSHPMAGSEKSGFSSARANLFENTVSIVTPTDETDPEAERSITTFWQALGAKVISLSPQIHDRYVAQISHLPHLMAASLIQTVSAESLSIIGNGFRDTTRIAAGSPELWAGILQANRFEVEKSLEIFIEIAERAKKLLAAGDENGLQEFLSQAHHRRVQL